MKKKKLGFALGAGGSRGVAHIGFLQAMEEANIRPDYITGCSMGSIVGSAYASGMTIEQMKTAVHKLRLLDLIAPTGKRGGLFETKKVRKLLTRYIGDIEFSDLKIPFRCIAVDMISQQVVEFSEGKLLDAVIASSSIPSIFCPMEKDGMRLIDGGILERVPYPQVKNMGADIVVAVDVLGNLSTKEKCPSTLGVLLETIDIMDNYRTKIRREANEDLYDFWLEPDLGTMNQYLLKEVKKAYEKGYEIGKEYAPKIKKALKA
ncbi:MAG: patatin-like phospholipase family protein [Clostridia bacterium]|nr:patatin-like phospholipase family protein [Clostridia bacterium]